MITKTCNHCNQSSHIIFPCILQCSLLLVIYTKVSFHVQVEKRRNGICWSIRIHREHVKRSHAMIRVGLKCKVVVVSIRIDVVINRLSIDGRVITKFMKWNHVHMMKQPFVKPIRDWLLFMFIYTSEFLYPCITPLDSANWRRSVRKRMNPKKPMLWILISVGRITNLKDLQQLNAYCSINLTVDGINKASKESQP